MAENNLLLRQRIRSASEKFTTGNAAQLAELIGNFHEPQRGYNPLSGRSEWVVTVQDEGDRQTGRVIGFWPERGAIQVEYSRKDPSGQQIIRQRIFQAEQEVEWKKVDPASEDQK